MKDWSTIGEFAKLVELTPRALRMYEDIGLLKSHTRGENGYRYYHLSQVEKAGKIKAYKELGFRLKEISQLLSENSDLAPDKMLTWMEQRLLQVQSLADQCKFQKDQIQSIISSIKSQTPQPLAENERKYIMSKLKNVTFAVTGTRNLEETKMFLEVILGKNHSCTVHLIPESELNKNANGLDPDVVIINNVSDYNKDILEKYLTLYRNPGPHMTTVFNADDRLSVQLAGNDIIRQGRTFYYSKNGSLKPQIQRIGGVISDGETIEAFGFNLNKEVQSIPLEKLYPFESEVNLLAAMTSVLDIGLSKERFKEPQ